MFIKKTKLLFFLLVSCFLFSCDKDSQVLRHLENGKWKISSYKKTSYLAGNVDNESSGTDVGYFTFEKNGTCSVAMSATLSSTLQTLVPETISLDLNNGKYDVFGSADDAYDAKMNVEFDTRHFYTYSIKEENKKKMRLTDKSNMQSYYGDGYIIEMTIEKE